MLDLREAEALYKQLGGILAHDALQHDQQSQREALRLSKALVWALEPPVNAAVEPAFTPAVTMCIRIAIDMKLFEALEQAQGSVSSIELAERTGTEELFIGRVLRLLSATGYVKEVGERTWEANAVTASLARKEIAAGHRYIHDILTNATVKAPKFFRQTGFKSPTDPTDGTLQFAHQTKLNLFDLLGTMPSTQRDFNLFMGNAMGTRKHWQDWYPVRERLLTDLEDGAPLLVDVGGGKGHDLEAFQSKFPNSGRLALEDLPHVVDSNPDLDREIERVAYDFFREQPLKGARAYFYHHILHDWSDDKCLEILGQVRQAMRPGYSKLLLHELILPETGASAFAAMLDFAMLHSNSGMERSGRQWSSLLERAGLELVKFWIDDEDADGIIEAVVRDD